MPLCSPSSFLHSALLPSLSYRHLYLFNFNDYHDQLIKNWQKKRSISCQTARQRSREKESEKKSFVIKKYSFWIIKSCAGHILKGKDSRKTRHQNKTLGKSLAQHEEVSSRNSFKFPSALISFLHLISFEGRDTT